MEADLLAGRISKASLAKSPTLNDAIERYLLNPPPGQEHTVEDYAWMLKFWKKSLQCRELREAKTTKNGPNEGLEKELNLGSIFFSHFFYLTVQ